jgi:hypothetical protein
VKELDLAAFDRRVRESVERWVDREVRLLEYSGLGLKLLTLPGFPEGTAIAASADGSAAVKVEDA